MFSSFFYLLRSAGLSVSLNEWLTLIEALDKGLCHSSLTDFYYLSRAVLVKSENDFDKFDMVFAEYFKNIKTESEIPPEVLKWLENPLKMGNVDKEAADKKFGGLGLSELQKMLEERLKEQKEAHNRGSYWIGTAGISPLGHSGYSPKGIRVGGTSKRHSALKVAGERKFRDFRNDNVLDVRQFQMAFRKLRQFSSREDGPKTELNIDETIDKTCSNAGHLKLVFDRPRKNTVKLLLLMDSDGSMIPYSRLCSALFQSVSLSNHFKDLKVYYFHNCIYDKLYTDPECRRGCWVDTETIMRTLNKDYKVIIIGDAMMSPEELFEVGGNIYGHYSCSVSGLEWLKRIKKQYEKSIWLNPISKDDWSGSYGKETIIEIENVFKMYKLTIKNLELALKELLVTK